MSILGAKLISWDRIEIISSADELPRFDLFIDGESVLYNFVDKNIITFSYNDDVLGHHFYLKSIDDACYIDISDAPKFLDFDEKYAYLDDDLGPNYSKDFTKFVLWAPLASSVYLRIDNKELVMTKGEKGTYQIFVDGDLDGKLYDYKIIISGEEIIACDPYAKSTNCNSKKSAVIDLEKIKRNMFDECLPIFNNNVEAIIYETSVRDISSSPSSGIKNKGKFLGLSERGTLSKNNIPTGLDYIASLGISHIQLLPVLDFASVDDLKEEQYNWGYDPLHFFALEGSYSTSPNDPYSRMNEFMRLVQSAHRLGIRINLDVVYNHVYKKEIFALNQITPNYFFRFENGEYANHSGCGNDFASERAMARKIIIDSLKFLLKTYDIDGFRFDLMGLIDLETIKLAESELHKIKPNLMIYGEGWSMGAKSEFADKFATLENALELPRVAFFNDRYRNIMRGPGDKAELHEKGYLLGNKDYVDGFKYIYQAGTNVKDEKPLFLNYSQSINYVECHDNATLSDVVLETIENSSEADLAKYIKLFNRVLIMSPGIVFVHAGQEYGQSKHLQANTYNLGDYYNAIDYDLRDERIALVESFKSYIKVRKSISLFKLSEPELINPNIEFDHVDYLIDISLKSNGIYHMVINIGDDNAIINENKYDNYHLYLPYKLRRENEKIVLKELGISSHKASIFKET